MADDRHLHPVPEPPPEAAAEAGSLEAPESRRSVPLWVASLVGLLLLGALAAVGWSWAEMDERLTALEAENRALASAIARRDRVIDAQRARLDDVRARLDEVASLLESPLPEAD